MGHKIHAHSRCAGISLIASSMILVLVGLILAALVSSHTLIRAAELRSIIVQADHFQTAYHNFEMKYGAAPGDYPIAVAQWGESTADGNGDGVVLGWEQEEVYAWQHLALSGILPETSATLKENARRSVVVGVNVPKTRLPETSFRFTARTDPLYNKRIGNTLELGAMGKDTLSDRLGRGALTGRDAMTVDSKIDDGIADNGQLYAVHGDGGNHCVTGTAGASTVTYMVGSDAADCRMVFWLN